MKKINTQDYTVGEKTFLVKPLLVSVLFGHENILAMQVRERNKIADKIEASTDFVELEDAEHHVLVDCINTIRGLSRGHLELIERIIGAENIA